MASIVDSYNGSEFERFSIEDVRLPEENFNRVTQQHEENISDLDITIESESEDENEDLDPDDHHLDQDRDVSERRNQFDPVQLDAFVDNFGPDAVLDADKKEIIFFPRNVSS